MLNIQNRENENKLPVHFLSSTGALSVSVAALLVVKLLDNIDRFLGLLGDCSECVNLGVKNVWIGSTIGFYTPFCQVHSHWIYLRNNNWLFCSCLLSMNGVIVRCKTREKHTQDPSEVG